MTDKTQTDIPETEVQATLADATDTADTAEAKPAINPDAMLTVSTSPHIKSADTTRSIMLDVIIALCPALIWGIYVFGFRALTVVLVSVLSAMGAEALYQKLMKKPITVFDFSAAVTGLLIGLNMPATIPLWIPVVGAFFAIVVVKQLYGGLGKNFMNPALAARAFLMLAWPGEMTGTPLPFTSANPLSVTVQGADIMASATPMQVLKSGSLPEGGMFNLLLGSKAGCIGEVSALLLIAGGVYLLVRKVISWHIPVAYIGTVAAICYFFPRVLPRNEFVVYELICGGLMLGAIYMATDYATSPVTATGRLIYGVGCGLITVFIRFFGGYAEGVTFSILIMNTLVWYIDRLTRPKRFGGAAKHAKAK